MVRALRAMKNVHGNTGEESGVGAVGFAKKRKLKGGGGELCCLPESEHEKILSCGHLGV